MLRFIVPAYNEERNIESLIEKTAQYAHSRKYEFEIIVVNDGSTDKTLDILKRLQKNTPITILDQVVNKGVGEAFKRGFRYVAEEANDNDIIVTKEADNTSDLSILDNMIGKIKEGSDLVLASCYMPGGSVKGTNFYRKILSAGANTLLKTTTSLKGIQTFSSFYRAYKAELIKKACKIYSDRLIEEKGFSCMVELLLKLSKLNIKIVEVPMVLRGEMRKGKSKMKTLKTIAGYIRLIIRNLSDGRRKIIVLATFGILGLLLRFIFIPFTMHQDILWVHMWASKMAYHGIFNIYGHIKTNFYLQIAGQGVNYYPPIAYFLFGSFYFFVKQMLPGLGAWLDLYSKMIASGDHSNYLALFQIPFKDLCLYISVMKIPYLVLDILCLGLLWKYFKNTGEKLRAYKFWMINPVIIFGSYIFGQFDIAVAFFVLTALFMIKKGRPYLGMFIIGCASLLKSVPLLLILPLCIILGDDIRKMARLFGAAIFPIIIVMAPFYFLTGNYMITALFPNFVGSGGASLIDTIEFSIGKGIFIIGYIFLLIRIGTKKDKSREMDIEVWRYTLGIMLLSYFIVYTPIHYFQWVIPLIIIGIVNGKIPRSIYIFQVTCLFVYAICSRQLSAQLFLPLNPDYLYTMKSLPEYMNQFMKWGVVMRVARFLFYSCSLYMIWKIIFKPEVKSA